MWRSKKFILVVVLGAVLLVGSLGGVVLADTDDDDDSQSETLYERVAAILEDDYGVNITSEQLEDAFSEARSDMRTDAMESFLDKMVEEDRISQEEADQYLEWWQSKPDISFGFGSRGLDGFRGMGRMGGTHGFGGMHGLGGSDAPDASEETTTE